MRKTILKGRQALALGAMLAAGSAPSFASLLEYSFQSPDGAQKTLSAVERYANPAGKINFALSAGLDRKVKVSFLDSDEAEVTSLTSHLLGVADRMEVNGKDYYGARLELAAPQDGAYQIKSEILDSSGRTIQVETHPIVIDTQPPSVGEFSWGMGYGGGIAPDGLPAFSDRRDEHITLNDVNDELSGVDNVKFTSYWETGPKTGEIYSSGPVTYHANKNAAMLGTGGVESGADVAFPSNAHSKNRVVYEVFDKAGNKGSKELSFYTNSKCTPIPEVVAVETEGYSGSFMDIPEFSGFKSVGGSTHITKNPITLLLRTPRENSRKLSEGAIFGGQVVNGRDKLVHVDDEYAYLTVNAVIPDNGKLSSIKYGWTNNSRWRCGSIVVPNPTFDPQFLPPKAVDLNAYVDGVGWIPRRYSANKGNPPAPRDTKISKFRFVMEPRVYTQKAFMRGESCLIPPGETSCEGPANLSFNRTGTAGHYSGGNLEIRKDGAGELMSPLEIGSVWEWDAADPTITGVVSSDAATGEVVFDAVKLHSGKTWGRVRMHKGGLVAVASDGTRRTFGGSLNTSGNDSRVTARYTGLGEGQYDILGYVEDFNNNRTEKHLLSIYNDTTSPIVVIEAPDSDVKSLDSITVSVSDADDPQPAMKSMRLIDGPASEDIQLSWREVSANRYRLEYPLMHPSVNPGEEYTLAVTVEDNQGNTTVEQKTFAFKPPTTIVNGDRGVWIPAVKQSITGHGVPPIYSEPVEFDDGTLVVGEYDLVATLRSDSDFGVNLLGYELQPGDTIIIDNYDFSANGSKVALPAYPTEVEVGTANLLVFPGAPGAQYVLAEINTWKPNPIVAVNGQRFSEGLTVQQALEPVSITVLPGPNDPCTYTADEAEALAANPLTDPMCSIVWNLPETVLWDESSFEASGYLTGVEDDVEIGYQIFIPQNGSARGVEVESVNEVIDIVHPDLSFGFDPDVSVTQYITEFYKGVVSTGGIECAPTVNPLDAKTGTQYGYPKCLIEWNLLPPGITSNHYSPSVFGIAEEPFEMLFTFDVTYYDPDQNAYLMPEQTIISLVDEPRPVVFTLPETEYDPEEDGVPRYFVSSSGGGMGSAHLSASGADVDMTITVDGEIISDRGYRHRSARERDASYQFNIWAGDMGLWEESSVELHGGYNLMPEINDTKLATVIGVPSSALRVNMDIGKSKILDTEGTDVTVQLAGDRAARDYNPETHGTWKVQLRYAERDEEMKTISGWKAIGPDGSVTIPVNMDGFDNGYMDAVARLDSPYEEYTRELQSRRSFIRILRGGEIDGEVIANRVSGPSVFNASLQVRVDNRGYSRAVGEVEWMMSTNGGAYEPVEGSGRSTRLRVRLDAGRYSFKARLTNKYTGATSDTSIQEIHVFDVPSVTIEGPGYAFKTQEVELIPSTELNREPVPIERFHVEWSEDGGETWEEGINKTVKWDGESNSLSYRVRVRDKDIPDDRGPIYRERPFQVRFIDERGPRARIYGPNRLERGKPAEYMVDLNTPRKNMDLEVEGEWIMPDGTIIPGSDPIVYNPTEADVDDTRIAIGYRAWVIGYRDSGAIAEYERRIYAWQYVWPEWDVFASARAMEAPAQIQLRPRTPGWSGWLDDEQYQWSFPAGTEVLRDSDRAPIIRIEEPGKYEINLLVTDARGNESHITKTLDLAEPAETVVDFRYYASNRYMRAPLEIRPRMRMNGGHRLDRVEDQEILVDGLSVEKGARIRSFEITEPGTYEITAKIYSKMGRVATETETLVVVENQAPVCTPAVKERIGDLIISANCRDEDGRVMEYIWDMAGERHTSRSYKFRVSEQQIADMGGTMHLEISAKDDVGEQSEVVVITHDAPER